MTNYKNNYVLILAGGKGRRLWPVSREAMPKQFLDFFSTGQTQLQQAWRRAQKLVPKENIFISTNKQYEEITRSQLPDAVAENILVEPIFRNTAPSLAWATFRVYTTNPNGNILVMPSDHAILDEPCFVESIAEAFKYVENADMLLTVGATPTRPEPGYGYVQLGEPLSADSNKYFKVKSFTEKPERSFAEMFVQSGEFLWNTGIFCGNVKFFRNGLVKIFPSTFRLIEEDETYKDKAKELEYVNEKFTCLPNMSIESGILEKSDYSYVMKADFGWADLGTWHTIYESMSKVEGENISISSRALFDHSKNNIVKLPDDHVAIIGNLDGYIVAEKGNVLLICKKEDSSALIKKYRNEVAIEFGNEFV